MLLRQALRSIAKVARPVRSVLFRKMVIRGFAVAASKMQTPAQNLDSGIEMEDDFEMEVENSDKKETFKISNPDEFDHDIPFPLVSYPPGTTGFTPENLKEVIGLDDGALEALKHFYSVPAGGQFSIEQCRAICWQYGFELVEEKIAEAQLDPRPPIVTIMGHVDHGKTTLLDGYRNSNLTGAEVGGITQKIGGFMVNTAFGIVSFIDTPGHSLFTNMRRTGASCTDIIILVISAIEGVQAQTLEVLRIIEESKIPVIVAINKIDSKAADPEAVEEQLWNLGVEIEPKGGNVPVVHISAVNKMNTGLLLELVLFEAERLKISANCRKAAQACAIEGRHVDLKNCAVILRNGVLHRGDWLVAANSYCKVQKILNDQGETLDSAVAGMAVQVVGFKTLPKTSEKLIVVSNEREAKEYMKLHEHFISLEEAKTLSASQIEGTKIKFKNRKERRKFHSGKKEVIEQKYQSMLEEMLEEKARLEEKGQSTEEIDKRIEVHQQTIDRFKTGDKTGLKLFLKANDIGTLDTMLTHSLNIKDNQGNRNFEIVKAEIGPLTEQDLIESLEFESKIYCMDVSYGPEIEQVIKDEGLDVRTFKIIYQYLEDLKKLNDSMNKDYRDIQVLGKATVKDFFDIKMASGSIF